MAGVRIVDMPDLGAVTDAASVVGEMAGSGRFSMPALRTYASATVTAALGVETAARKRDFVSVMDYGAVGDGTTDDTAAFVAALARHGSAVSIKGGTVLAPGGYTFRVGNFTIPSGVTLMGAFPAGIGAPGLGNFSPPYGTLSSLRLTSGSTITLNGGGAISGLFIAPDGMTFQQTTSSGFAGTAITVAGDDIVVERSMILGFAQGITSTNYSRLRLRDLNMDCVGGVYVNNSTDVCHFDRLQMWPYATISQAGTDTLRRSGYGIRMVNCNDDSRITDCFTYGYAEGFSIEGCIGTVMTSCSADSTNVGIGIGFNIVGGATEIQLIDCEASAQNIGYNITPTVASDTLVTVSNCAAWSNSVQGILVDSAAIGDVTIRGGSIVGSPNGITIASATSRVDIDGVRFETITGAAAISVTVATSRVRIGPMCNFGTSGSGTGGVAAGANLTIPVVASASAIGLPPNAAMVSITGTTSIGTINGGWAGRVICLIFAATCPVLSTFTGAAGAVRLAGGVSITASVGSTLTLIHNGTQWHQIGGTPAGHIDVVGSPTNDTAGAGQVGEYVTATLASGSAISLTTGTPANVTSISLTAGDWDLDGTVCFTVSASLTVAQSWVNTVSAATPTAPAGGYAVLVATIGSGTLLPTGTTRLSLAATTTVYLGAYASFVSGTCSAYGMLRARRVR